MLKAVIFASLVLGLVAEDQICYSWCKSSCKSDSYGESLYYCCNFGTRKADNSLEKIEENCGVKEHHYMKKQDLDQHLQQHGGNQPNYPHNSAKYSQSPVGSAHTSMQSSCAMWCASECVIEKSGEPLYYCCKYSETSEKMSENCEQRLKSKNQYYTRSYLGQFFGQSRPAPAQQPLAEQQPTRKIVYEAQSPQNVEIFNGDGKETKMASFITGCPRNEIIIRRNCRDEMKGKTECDSRQDCVGVEHPTCCPNNCSKKKGVCSRLAYDGI